VGWVEVYAADWKYCCRDAVKSSEVLYDAKNMVRLSEKSVRVWVKIIFSEIGVGRLIERLRESYKDLEHGVVFMELDCRNKMRRFFSKSNYSRDGMPLYSVSDPTEFEFIRPESLNEALFEIVCDGVRGTIRE
jgi:hypothetical protein